MGQDLKNYVPDPLFKTCAAITTELDSTRFFGQSWGGSNRGWREEAWREESMTCGEVADLR